MNKIYVLLGSLRSVGEEEAIMSVQYYIINLFWSDMRVYIVRIVCKIKDGLCFRGHGAHANINSEKT